MTFQSVSSSSSRAMTPRDLDLLDLADMADKLANLADVEWIVITLGLGLGMGDVGVLPGLYWQEKSVCDTKRR